MFVVSENIVYKPNYQLNTWVKYIHTNDEKSIINNLKKVQVNSFILFKVNNNTHHNYTTIFRLMADVQYLDICSIFGVMAIDFKTIKNTVIVTYDAEAG